MEIPDIIQGTDGIRGRILDTDQMEGLTPLEYFLKFKTLTPAFFELYAYAYGRLLLKMGNAEKNDSIVIGWDPRDKGGKFTQAAINGIRKAGLTVIKVGILPTPAIPLYMLTIKAAGGMVLTASHNPADQNGIKIFHGFTALKFLPSDDLELTRMLGGCHKTSLNELKMTGKLEDHTAEARRFFISYLKDGRNSWISGQDFSDIILVIDASKGAVAEVVQEVFASYTFKNIIYTNLKGDINTCCGVAELENRTSISADQVLDPSSLFHDNLALREMFKQAEEVPEIKAGTVKLSALVFDGDGDRCFRLDYHPDNEKLMISSGDFLGIHQALYIQQKNPRRKSENWFVNTVESDLSTAIYAQEQGYVHRLTGVGDKWILLTAVKDYLFHAVLPDKREGKELIQFLSQSPLNAEISGLRMSNLWKKCFLAGRKPPLEDASSFQIGVEESGHCITPGYIQINNHWVKVFAGNGLKTGLNSLATLQDLASEISSEEWLNRVAQPHPSGIKKTHYIYYVDKSKLLPGNPFRASVESALMKAFREIFPQEYTSKLIEFSEETSLLYCQINKDNTVMGALFIRNSGTEDKSAVYLNGQLSIAAYLRKLGDILHLQLLSGQKDVTSDLAKLELQLLKHIEAKTDTTLLSHNHSPVLVIRVLKEMELKEELIERSQQEYPYQLTEKGRQYLKMRAETA